MLLIRANPLRGQVVGGWAVDIDTFFGPLKWPLAVIDESAIWNPKSQRAITPHHF
jgi:hypothetical protein